MSSKREQKPEMTVEPEAQTATTGAQTATILNAILDRVERLERRLDQLYRYTVGDRTGWRYPVPSFAIPGSRDDDFPAPDYDAPGGPRKPQGAP